MNLARYYQRQRANPGWYLMSLCSLHNYEFAQAQTAAETRFLHSTLSVNIALAGSYSIILTIARQG
jgi:hypothetical protein